MKKILFTSAFVLCHCLNALSQATSLTIDCQTPGWLSSMINYTDQQTVVDLTITGYLNTVDMNFIGTMMKLHSLKRLDLENVDIVSSDAEKQNVLTKDIFDIGSQYECHMDKILLPLSIKKIWQSPQVDVAGCFSNYLYVDTLVMGGPAMPTIENSVYGKMNLGSKFCIRVKCLILREGVETIADRCFYYYDWYGRNTETIFETVVLPKSLKKIGISSFSGNCFQTLDLPDSVEEIEADAFRCASSSPEEFWKPNTLFLPNSIKKFNISAFNSPSKVYYFPEGIEYIDNIRPVFYNQTEEIINIHNSIEFHLKASTPPTFNYQSYNCLGNSVVYVPKGTSSQYMKTAPWKQATIIEEIYAEGVSIENKLDLHVDETTKPSVMVLPTDATNKNVILESSNPEIVEVLGNEIHTLAYGTAVVTVTTEDGGYMASCTVNVYEHTTGIEMVDKISLPVGKTHTLSANTLPFSTSDGKITFTIDNDEIASISENGIVLAKKKGTCHITATSVDGGFTATCEVTVTQPVEALTLEKHSISLNVGDEEKVFAQVLPVTADDKAVVWTSSDGDIASVDENGNITALKGGEVWIIAVSQDNSEAKDSCKVIVKQPVTGIKLDNNTCELNGIGGSIELKATVEPNDASNKNVKWTSSDESVCVVGNGQVVAVGNGTCVIIATTEDGGYIATCTVTVTDAMGVSSIQNDGNSFQLYDTNGAKRINFQRGVNIIRFADGTMKKILIK